MPDFAFAEAAFAFSDCSFSVNLGRTMHVSLYRHMRDWLIAEMKELEFDANNAKEMNMLTIETEAWRLAEIASKRCEERATEIFSDYITLPQILAESSLEDVVREALLDEDNGVLVQVKLEFWQHSIDNLNTLIDRAWLGKKARR